MFAASTARIVHPSTRVPGTPIHIVICEDVNERYIVRTIPMPGTSQELLTAYQYVCGSQEFVTEDVARAWARDTWRRTLLVRDGLRWQKQCEQADADAEYALGC